MIVIPEFGPGAIDARDVDVLWDEDEKRLKVVRFDPAHGYKEQGGFDYSFGAQCKNWTDDQTDDDERVNTLLQYAIEFMCLGFEPFTVMKEFVKVRQIFELGEKSNPMCRVLSRGITGRGLGNPSLFRVFFLSGDPYGRDWGRRAR